VIAAEVEVSTTEVRTWNVALVAPPGMSKLGGTVAAPLLLERETCAPTDGAGPVKVTVPVEDCSPPTTLEGFSTNEESWGGGGVTVSCADLVSPP
jgi:hypothetical protein